MYRQAVKSVQRSNKLFKFLENNYGLELQQSSETSNYFQKAQYIQQNYRVQKYLKSFSPYQVLNQSQRDQSTATVQSVQTKPPLSVYTDLYGSVVSKVANEQEEQIDKAVYQNRDGLRVDDGRYTAFKKEISSFVQSQRIFDDPIRTFSYGTDASFFRLNPKIVIKVANEQEIVKILPLALKHQVPVTFRSAGTSLSGQAVSDSVLLKVSHVGKNFRGYQVHGDGSSITVEPGLIGGEVNKILANFAKKTKQPITYKIGPDPSSIDSAMMGGIVSNNSSGMCCGVAQNTYNTLKDIRVVFYDGTVLDTADEASRQNFLMQHGDLVQKLQDVATKVQGDEILTNLIRRKFAIKCTTGYSINALIDFPVDNPIEMIKRLVIGSEGTFGFVSRATINTVPEWPHKSSAFVLFPDIACACRGASVLRSNTGVDAVELFDRPSLVECAKDDDMLRLVPDLKHMGDGTASLLIECRGQTKEDMMALIEEVQCKLRQADLEIGPAHSKKREVTEFPFFQDPADFSVYWNFRKGLIPIVGGTRETGTSMLLEDVVCPVENLAAMTTDLQEMFERHGYKGASCFGHALEGNLHLVFSQGFRDAKEVERFDALVEEMCYIVATKHSGSLKGEHGTGRAIAPYVAMEWGEKAEKVMWDLKQIFDPHNIINPGVVLTDDKLLHIQHLKTSHAASPIVDKCIECGFCESNCPSRDITLTPRQRIVTWREIHRLRDIGDGMNKAEKDRLKSLEDAYVYDGDATCAADGMCQVKCPVHINTGDLIKQMRAENLHDWKYSNALAKYLANNFTTINYFTPVLLNSVSLMHRIMGSWILSFGSGLLNKMSFSYIPVWNPYLPMGASKVQMPPPQPIQTSGNKGGQNKVVYMPACVTRIMGPSYGDPEKESVHEKMLSILQKAGYEIIYPENLNNLCCGMLFNTRGLKASAQQKGTEVEKAILKASDNGKYPILCDTAPCVSQIKSQISEPILRFNIYEPVDFIHRFVKDKLEFDKVRQQVAVHVPCSTTKMGNTNRFMDLVGLCSDDVYGSGVPCCGTAGDRGMRYPELTKNSVQHSAIPEGCKDGYSESRTCEMTMSLHSNGQTKYRSLVYLIDEASRAKKQQQATV